MVEPEGFAMPAIALRQDYDAARLRGLALIGVGRESLCELGTRGLG